MLIPAIPFRPTYVRSRTFVILIEFLGFLQAKLRLLAKELRLGTMMSPERATLVLGEHRKIVDAILSRDPMKAREAVLEHLRNAAKRANLQIYAP